MCEPEDELKSPQIPLGLAHPICPRCGYVYLEKPLYALLNGAPVEVEFCRNCQRELSSIKSDDGCT